MKRMKIKTFIVLCILLANSISYSQEGERIGGKGGNGEIQIRLLKRVLAIGYTYKERDCQASRQSAHLIERICTEVLKLSTRGAGQEDYLFYCCIGNYSSGANAKDI